MRASTGEERLGGDAGGRTGMERDSGLAAHGSPRGNVLGAPGQDQVRLEAQPDLDQLWPGLSPPSPSSLKQKEHKFSSRQLP